MTNSAAQTKVTYTETQLTDKEMTAKKLQAIADEWNVKYSAKNTTKTQLVAKLLEAFEDYKTQQFIAEQVRAADEAKAEKEAAKAAKQAAKAEKKVTEIASKAKRTEWEAIGEIKAVAEGSKVHAILLTLLEGQSTIDEINAKHPRNKTQHTFITYDVIRLGYGVKINDKGQYQLVLPNNCQAIAIKAEKLAKLAA